MSPVKPAAKFRESARLQRSCQSCGATRVPWSAHHAVYLQHVRRAGGSAWARDNALRLCDDCHNGHHNRSRPVRATALTQANIDYAFDLLGQAAYDYLRRRYAGDDPRLDWALLKMESEAA